RLVEIAPRTSGPPERRRAEEAERLKAALPRDAVLVALDESGRSLTSRAFAARIAAWQRQGRSELVFLIGGPEGLDPALLDRADLVLALGRMTWPHRFVRVLLAEQLYRAATIQAGHPYHRDCSRPLPAASGTDRRARRSRPARRPDPIVWRKVS